MVGKGGERPPLLVLAGPTAVGKSALALELAPRLNAEIISADSAQVYRRLDIGTAKPTPAERRSVPHHLIDLVEPDEEFSVADYQKAAYQVIEEVLQRKRLPFMVGGTGLYIRAVTEGYVFGEKGKNEQLRRRLAQEAREKGLETLYRRLKELDPAAAVKIHPHDQRRIIRALEVYQVEGKPISRQVTETARRTPPFDVHMFGLTMERALLYRRIEQRVEAMFEQGFLEEVKELLRLGYPPDSPGLQILGYRQLVQHLQGKISREEALEEIKKQTRRLAKRQLTWFCRDKRIFWLEMDKDNNLQTAVEIIAARVKEILPPRTNNIS